MPRIATSDIFDSETGVLYPKGSVVPEDASDAVFIEKERGRRTLVPGFADSAKATTTKIAGDDKPKDGAGQNGAPPAKKPAQTRAQKNAAKKAAATAAATGTGTVEQGGPARGKADDSKATEGTSDDSKATEGGILS